MLPHFSYLLPNTPYYLFVSNPNLIPSLLVFPLHLILSHSSRSIPSPPFYLIHCIVTLKFCLASVVLVAAERKLALAFISCHKHQDKGPSALPENQSLRYTVTCIAKKLPHRLVSTLYICGEHRATCSILFRPLNSICIGRALASASASTASALELHSFKSNSCPAIRSSPSPYLT